MARWVMALAACTLAVTVARAHDTGVHAKGTVKEVTPSRIVLLTSDGKTFSAEVSPRTRVVRGSTAVSLDAVRPGERAVVHTEEDGTIRRAIMIKLGESPSR